MSAAHIHERSMDIHRTRWTTGPWTKSVVAMVGRALTPIPDSSKNDLWRTYIFFSFLELSQDDSRLGSKTTSQ